MLIFWRFNTRSIYIVLLLIKVWPGPTYVERLVFKLKISSLSKDFRCNGQTKQTQSSGRSDLPCLVSILVERLLNRIVFAKEILLLSLYSVQQEVGNINPFEWSAPLKARLFLQMRITFCNVTWMINSASKQSRSRNRKPFKSRCCRGNTCIAFYVMTKSLKYLKQIFSFCAAKKAGFFLQIWSMVCYESVTKINDRPKLISKGKSNRGGIRFRKE